MESCILKASIKLHLEKKWIPLYLLPFPRVFCCEEEDNWRFQHVEVYGKVLEQKKKSNGIVSGAVILFLLSSWQNLPLATYGN